MDNCTACHDAHQAYGLLGCTDCNSTCVYAGPQTITPTFANETRPDHPDYFFYVEVIRLGKDKGDYNHDLDIRWKEMNSVELDIYANSMAFFYYPVFDPSSGLYQANRGAFGVTG